jgi:hypothetical protein
MQLSLRTRFILALLLTSFLVAAGFGLVARWLLLRDFGRLALEDAFEHFRVDVSAYSPASSIGATSTNMPLACMQRRCATVSRSPW